MRKLNPNRVRRYRAVSTPDTVVLRINKADDYSERIYQDWLHAFRDKMRIKHPDLKFDITVYMDEQIGFAAGEIVITAEIHPLKQNLDSQESHVL